VNINAETYANLPFKEPNERFKDVLYHEYIIKAVDWIEKASSGAAFAQNYGSYWEAAYALEYLLDVKKIVNKKNENAYLVKIKKLCYAIVVFLLNHSTDIPIKERKFLNHRSGEWVEINERTNWDGNTWDTSVVCNALLYYIDTITGDDEFGSDEFFQKMWTVLPNAIKWLYDQFDNNRGQYSQYSFGSVDYSRILILFIYIIKSKYQKKLLKKAKLTKGVVIKAIHDLAEYIDKEKVSEKVSIYNELTKMLNDETVINWGDCFITSEICDALGRYLNFLAENKLSKNHDAWTESIYSTLKKAMRSVEAMQSSEGMWGAHDDTIRCLSSYLTTTSELKNFERVSLNTNGIINSKAPQWIKKSDCEEHKVFKAIRWLLDPKQLFSDGSYLHTPYLSVFMFEAFIVIHNHWDFADNKTLYKIYDEVFWVSPARTTQEKGQVIELEIEQDRKIVEIKYLKSKFRIMSLFLAVTALVALFLLTSNIFGLLKFQIIYDNNDGDTLSVILTVIVLMATTIGARYFNIKGDD
jgi:hypothetical protein